jgi:hypothetical protein
MQDAGLVRSGKEDNMKRMVLSLVLAIGPAFVVAQVRPTEIGGHRVGETLQEWLSINHLDLGEICGPRMRAQKHVDSKVMCKNLSAFRDGETGTFSTKDETGRTLEWLFVDAKVAEVSMTQELDFYAGGSHWSPSSAEEQVRFLGELYGPPDAAETIPYQNSFGAKWTAIEATWKRPDGTVIIGSELITVLESGPARSFRVRFVSKARMELLRKVQQEKTNPYAR